MIVYPHNTANGFTLWIADGHSEQELANSLSRGYIEFQDIKMKITKVQEYNPTAPGLITKLVHVEPPTDEASTRVISDYILSGASGMFMQLGAARRLPVDGVVGDAGGARDANRALVSRRWCTDSGDRPYSESMLHFARWGSGAVLRRVKRRLSKPGDADATSLATLPCGQNARVGELASRLP
jgi:hypothetical protein